VVVGWDETLLKLKERPLFTIEKIFFWKKIYPVFNVGSSFIV